MGAVKANDTTRAVISDGRTYYHAKTDKLMVTVIDFNDGPGSEPDPPHSHPHEQVTYVVSGEIEVFIGDEMTHLAAGDLFTVLPNTPHTIRLLTDHVRLVDSFHPVREDLL